MKVAQHNKISKVILKMLLIERMSCKQYRKIITFADDKPARLWWVPLKKFSCSSKELR